MTNHGLIQSLASVQDRMKVLKHEEAALKAKIAEAYADLLKDFGSVSHELGGHKVTFTIPKNVDYDQAQLAELYARITETGQDAEEYIKVSYDVSESKFKAWPKFIQKQFVEARTVSKGSLQIKIEEINNA